MLQHESKPAIVSKLKLDADMMLKAPPIAQIVDIQRRILTSNTRNNCLESLRAARVPCFVAVVVNLDAHVRPVACCSRALHGTPRRVTVCCTLCHVNERGTSGYQA